MTTVVTNPTRSAPGSATIDGRLKINCPVLSALASTVKTVHSGNRRTLQPGCPIDCRLKINYPVLSALASKVKLCTLETA